MMQFKNLRQVKFEITMGRVGYTGRFAATYGSRQSPFVVAVNIYRTEPGETYRSLAFTANQIEQAMCVRFATFAKQYERMVELLALWTAGSTDGDSFLTYILEQPEDWEQPVDKLADPPF